MLPGLSKVWAQNQSDNCECYLKLDSLGIPLHAGEEEEANSESGVDISYETAYESLGRLKINGEVTEYPVVENDELCIIFQQMKKVIPSLADFEINSLSFWMLDMFIEGLSTAQKADFPHEHQKATLEWIAYFFNYIKSNNPTRNEMFSHLKMLLLVHDDLRPYELYGEGYTGEYPETDEEVEEEWTSTEDDNKEWELPLPPGVSRPTEETNTDVNSSNETKSPPESWKEIPKRSHSSGSETGKEKPAINNLKNMMIILEILYRIFGRLWVFLEIQTAFRSKPNVTQVELPFKLNFPKPLCKLSEPLAVNKSEKKISGPKESESRFQGSDCFLPLQASEDAKFYLNSASDRLPLEKGKGKK